MKRVYKCAENIEHVKKANIQVSDVIAILDGMLHFKINTFFTHKIITEMCGDGLDISLNHDIAHMVCEDMIVAWKAGHKLLNSQMMTPIMIELNSKQIACKNGEDHN